MLTAAEHLSTRQTALLVAKAVCAVTVLAATFAAARAAPAAGRAQLKAWLKAALKGVGRPREP
eukprot:SAG22_NODE_12016_length_459_cov_1.288889_2_plen_62_part_01